MIDDPTAPFEIEADDFLGHVASHIKGVAALAADDGGDDTRPRTLDKEMVVAFEAVNVERLHVVVAHAQAGAENRLVGDDEVVTELGSDDHHLVEAGAAVEIDRRVDVVEHGVGALAANGLGRAFGGQAVLAYQRKGADNEHVVAVVAFEPGLGLVAVHGELVIAGAAVARQGKAHAAAQETGGGLDGAEGVAHGHRARWRRRNSGRAVHLPDLDLVVAGASVQRGQRGVVVHRKEVVAAEAANDQARVDVFVVVDALDVGARLRTHVR